MAYLRCTACQGTKQLMSMGTFIKPCYRCNATGYEEDCEEEIVELLSPPPVAETAEEVINEAPVIKRGRKPRLPTEDKEITDAA